MLQSTRGLLALVLSCLIGAAAVRSVPHGPSLFRRDNSPSNFTFALYYANWDMYDRQFPVSSLPIDYIPELDYAFVQLKETPAGSGQYAIASTDSYADFDRVYASAANMPVQGNLGSLMALKKAGKQFNLKLALGGWTLSANFSPAVATDASRKTLVDSIISFFNQYPIFNGLSLDWEYVSNDGVNYGASGNIASASDSDNLILFLKALRAALAADNKSDYELAFCTSAAPEKIKYDVKSVSDLVDVFHVMTYDFASSTFGDTVTTHQANLYPTSNTRYSASAAVDFYLNQGVPAGKLMIGAAMYSRGFANTQGLGSSGSGVVSVKSWEDGVADYKVLPPQGFVEMWDDKAQATYAYSSSSQQFLSYDSVRSIQAKCAYVREKGLRGIVAWEASGDTDISDHDRSLVYALYQGLVSGSSSSVVPSAFLSAPTSNASDATSVVVAAVDDGNSTTAPDSQPVVVFDLTAIVNAGFGGNLTAFVASLAGNQTLPHIGSLSNIRLQYGSTQYQLDLVNGTQPVVVA